jgi:hypothetical protein
MANPEYLQILQQGVEAWNQWREQHREIRPDLTKVDLAGADLRRADLGGAYLFGANLSKANLTDANLRGAYLFGANLRRAYLYRTDLSEADLRNANLDEADLPNANLTNANLTNAILSAAIIRGAIFREANLTKAQLQAAFFHRTSLARADVSEATCASTVFSETSFIAVQGLDTCRHISPSTLDHDTLAQSWPLPLAFLRGCGLNDWEIETTKLYQPCLTPTQINDIVYRIYNLRADPSIQFHSCFISYASRDQSFAEQLYADLQNQGVRCWFAPEHMKMGDRLRLRIDETIRVYDKLLLVLSKASMASQWVEQEVETALTREREQDATILFPVRIDNMVMTIKTGWPALIRNTRNIGDFRRWKTHGVYKKAFDRLLRDLKAAATQP